GANPGRLVSPLRSACCASFSRSPSAQLSIHEASTTARSGAQVGREQECTSQGTAPAARAMAAPVRTTWSHESESDVPMTIVSRVAMSFLLEGLILRASGLPDDAQKDGRADANG